jgi:hypothetical protein
VSGYERQQFWLGRGTISGGESRFFVSAISTSNNTIKSVAGTHADLGTCPERHARSVPDVSGPLLNEARNAGPSIHL